MFAHEHANGWHHEQFGDFELRDVAKHLGQVEGRHDVHGDAQTRICADEVPLSKGVVHGNEAEGRGVGLALPIGRVEGVEVDDASAVGDVVVVR